MLGKIQGFTPTTLYVINRDGEESQYNYSKYEGVLLEAIEGSRKILQGNAVSPTYGSCGFPWESYCNRMAEETNDISLVTGIHSLKTKNKLVSHGFKTIKDLAHADVRELMTIKGIGAKTASKFIHAAKAIQTKKPIIKDRNLILFPNKKVEIFLDLEGTDPTTHGQTLPMLIHKLFQGSLRSDEICLI